ncbi:hypothetical protein BR93DRAFT_962044 [Coniochaeta sp. PMI_546]|nr:hypothetical protein BR93DRAFT_962044 [Coniochaeta sp. PMI_546]
MQHFLAKMTSRLEALPKELLWQIVSYLCPLDGTRLLRCSKKLHSAAEVEVYRSKDVLNEAMLFACSFDRPDIIRLAASYGASVNIVYGTKALRRARPVSIGQRSAILTLYLTALRDSIDSFRTLIELGARLDGPDLKGLVSEDKLHDLIEAVIAKAGHPTSEAFFRLYLDAGLDQQVQALDKDGRVSYLLAPLVRFEAPLEVIQLFLDRGADPNRTHYNWVLKYSYAPLPEAISNRSFPAFRLLIERGASIHGVEVREVNDPAMHRPLFRVAQILAEDGFIKGAPWIQACLDNGGDFNQVTEVMLNDQPGISHPYTPLLYFIRTVDGEWWDYEELKPVEGLKLLLNAGASPDGLGRLATMYDNSSLDSRKPMSCLQLLLRTWRSRRSVQIVTNDTFRAAIELLIKHGAARNEMAFILAYYTAWDDCHKRPLKDLAGECILTTMLINDIPRQDASLVMWQYVWCMSVGFRGGPICAGELNTKVVRDIMARGADINDMHIRGGADDSEDEDAEPMPILHAVCRRYAGRLAMGDPGDPDPPPHCHYMAFFEWLIRQGANPNIRVNGRTAHDILVGDSPRQESDVCPLARLRYNPCSILQGH